MADLEIMLIDNYKVPGLSAMVIDIVFKNNTPNYIQVSPVSKCGSANRLVKIICIPPFVTSGYYLLRTENLQTCPYDMSLTVYRCGISTSCPTPATTCAWSDILATGTIPVYRVVATIPTKEEILAKVTEVPIGPIIEAISATPVSIECQAPCDVVIDITWKNNGNQPGSFTPAIVVSNVRIVPHSTQSLAIGASVTKRFTLTGLVVGTYYIESDPGGITIPITVTGIGEPPEELPEEPPSNNTGLLLIGVGILGIMFLSKKK